MDMDVNSYTGPLRTWCPDCGAEQPMDVPGGVCPSCGYDGCEGWDTEYSKEGCE